MAKMICGLYAERQCPSYPKMCEHCGAYRVYTNRDRLSDMSDEELAEFIYKAFCQEYFPKQYLEWLQEPAEEVEDDTT